MSSSTEIISAQVPEQHLQESFSASSSESCECDARLRPPEDHSSSDGPSLLPASQHHSAKGDKNTSGVHVDQVHNYSTHLLSKMNDINEMMENLTSKKERSLDYVTWLKKQTSAAVFTDNARRAVELKMSIKVQENMIEKAEEVQAYYAMSYKRLKTRMISVLSQLDERTSSYSG